jgi:indolepyruvate ferredoxin oxidoreductase
LGRLAVARPEEFAQLMHSPLADKKVTKRSDAELIEERARELAAYQNSDYANKYRIVMDQVLLAEKDLAPGHTAFSRAVAEYLFKLMAYKDEYEVARLSLDPETTAKMAAEFGADARITYLLHPPILKSLGVSRKLRFGSWFRIVFRLLRKMRFIRGTKLDLFGYAAVRKLERNLLQEYRETIFSLLPTLNSANYDLAVQIAALPDLIRGYEEIKVNNAQAYRAQLAESIQQFTELISIEPIEGR